jgi:hypothetical protein
MMKAYHFLKDDMRASSGKEKPWKVGEERTVPEPELISLCAYGYHSAPSWRDALQYAPGPVACIVEVSDPIDKDDTKQVSATRELLAAKDVSKELRLFACDCAERALKRERKAGREPDERSSNAIIVARRYASGKATLTELNAAASATYRANSGASAAYSAASAAYSAASATYSANSAASAAYSDNSAEIKWQRKRLARYLDAVFAEGNL